MIHFTKFNNKIELHPDNIDYVLEKMKVLDMKYERIYMAYIDEITIDLGYTPSELEKQNLERLLKD